MPNKEDVRIFYNNYSTKQKMIGVNERHQSILKKLKEAGLKKDSKVLEIGCGIGTQSGLILKYLSKKGILNSYDISNKSIEIAQKQFKKYDNANFIVADLTQTEIEGQFDVIVLPDVIEHIPIENHNTLFNYLRKVLKPTGFMFIHIPFANYLDWTHKNRSELLQIIDQPIYLDALSKTLFQNDFIVETVKTYCIYTMPYDYQAIVCKPWIKEPTFRDVGKPSSFLKKVKFKIMTLGR